MSWLTHIILYAELGRILTKHTTLNPAIFAVLGLHGSSGKLTGSTSSLNKLTVQGSNSRRSQSSSLLDMGNMSASDLDVADRTKFDKVALPEKSRLSQISKSVKLRKYYVFALVPVLRISVFVDI